MPEDRDLPGFSVKKKVDESWKDEVAKEKGGAPAPVSRNPEIPSANEEPQPPPAADPPKSASPRSQESGFTYFISTLGMQALMFLGDLQEPGFEPRVDLAQARYIIEVLEMLAEKTHSNLAPEEDQMLQNLLYELRVKFVEKTQPPPMPGMPGMPGRPGGPR